MMNIALIPARGGSKGIPGKNLIPFRGEPLLVHSIRAAQESGSVHSILVSTDDDAIAAAAENAGASVIRRPAAISGDTATTESAVEHCLEVLRKNNIEPDKICLLQATSPLRPAGAVEQAFQIFQNGSFDSLLSISPTHRFFWRIRGNETAAEYDFMNRQRRQDIKPEELRYVENGSLYLFSRIHFNTIHNRLGGRIGHIIFPEEYSYEIDTVADLKFLESLAESMNE